MVNLEVFVFELDGSFISFHEVQSLYRLTPWEGWKDASGALGRIPYVKGALFLDRLRTELGEEKFWRGVAQYTSRNAGRLVDTQDFEDAMEEASGRGWSGAMSGSPVRRELAVMPPIPAATMTLQRVESGFDFSLAAGAQVPHRCQRNRSANLR